MPIDLRDGVAHFITFVRDRIVVSAVHITRTGADDAAAADLLLCKRFPSGRTEQATYPHIPARYIAAGGPDQLPETAMVPVDGTKITALWRLVMQQN
ncbi:MAG: hypothetical protein L3J36_10020 [Rhodobacteraceae bacterium]|nr:hypothetical protein [Paracoccaceae bacterium]